MKYQGIMLSLISMPLFSIDVPKDQDIKDFLQRSSAFQIFQKIDAIKIKTFSMNSFIQHGLDQTNLDEWNALINQANQLVEEAFNQKVPKYMKYKVYAHSVYLTSNLVQKVIQILHEKYKNLYTKDTDESKKPMLQIKRRLRPADLNQLQEFLKSLPEKAAAMREISDVTFDNLLKDAPIPTSWSAQLYNEKGKIKDAADIMKNYQAFLDEYTKQKNLDVFMTKNKITDQKSAENIINQLEQIAFIMEEKLKTDSKNKKRQANLKTVKKIIVDIDQRFPENMSTLQVTLFNLSTDKPSMILFAESSALESVLHQLTGEVNELYQAAIPQK